MRNSYEQLAFDVLLSDFKVKITTFFVIGNSETFQQNENWKRISEDIALKYQSKIFCISDKWNVYILYLSKDKMPKDLKNKVETDKFSSRKIVEEEFRIELSEKIKRELIIKHITGEDLIEFVNDQNNKIQDNKERYLAENSIIWESIPEESIKGDKEWQEKLLINIEAKYKS